jgi:hypothetical protein
MAKQKIKNLAEDVYFLTGSKAVVEYTGKSDRMSNESAKAEDIKTEWVPCYKSSGNSYWDEIIQVTEKNGISPSILETRRQFIIGGGIVLNKTVVSEGKKRIEILDKAKYPEIKAFLEDNDYTQVKSNQCDDLIQFGSYFEQNRTIGRGKSVKTNEAYHVDATTARSGIINPKTGFVDSLFLCDDWKKPKYDPQNTKDNNVERLDAFHRKALYPQKGKAIYHGKGYSAGYPYYPKPKWHGLLDWMKLSNKIPIWHLSGIENGYHIKYHIKIPLSYFDRFPADKRETEKTRMREQMNEWLAGAENVGKAFVSYKIANGTAADEWEIVPIEAMLHDEAFTTLYNETQLTITSGHGMHPAMAGIQIPNKLSNASEMRIAYYVYMSLKTSDIRSQLLAPLYLYKKVNGWAEEVEFGFENIEVTKLDENPTGSQTVMVG